MSFTLDSTYEINIATNILAQYGVTLPVKELKQVMEDTASPYRGIVALNAARLLNELRTNQVDDSRGRYEEVRDNIERINIDSITHVTPEEKAQIKDELKNMNKTYEEIKKNVLNARKEEEPSTKKVLELSRQTLESGSSQDTALARKELEETLHKHAEEKSKIKEKLDPIVNRIEHLQRTHFTKEKVQITPITPLIPQVGELPTPQQ